MCRLSEFYTGPLEICTESGNMYRLGELFVDSVNFVQAR